MSLTKQQLAGKRISTSFNIPDETWKALKRDKKRRRYKKFIKVIGGILKQWIKKFKG